MVMKMNVFCCSCYFNLFVTLLQDDCPSDPCDVICYICIFSPQVYFLGPFYIIFCTDLLFDICSMPWILYLQFKFVIQLC